MDIKTLISFLSSTVEYPVLEDVYWNNVKLLLRLDKESNAKGLPLYRDYSKYQYQVREWKGTHIDSNILIVDNDDSVLPKLNTTGTIEVDSFAYINNQVNHQLRITELNSNPTPTFATTIRPSYYEILLNTYPLDIGTGDFTVEFSFCADNVDLPWRWQTLWMVGYCLDHTASINTTNLKTYMTVIPNMTGWGMFLRDSDLVFLANNKELKLNSTPLVANTWYHVAVQRLEGVLTCYINSQQTFSQAFTTALLDPTSEYSNRLKIGAGSPMTLRYLGVSGVVGGETYRGAIDISYSGGFSNFRITDTARYTSSFYNIVLPFGTVENDNKIDTFYADTLFNLPISYDFFNYAANPVHFFRQELLKGAPDYKTGFLPITGKTIYETNTLAANLNDDYWTIEFFLCLTVNGAVEYRHTSTPYNVDQSPLTLQEWLNNYRINTIYPGSFLLPINIISLRSDDKPVLQINLNIVKTPFNMGGYFAFKSSSDGETWNDYLVDDNIDWNSQYVSNPDYLLPNDELKFFPSYTNSPVTDLAMLSTEKSIIQSGYSQKPLHIAVIRNNDTIVFLVNGEVIKTVPFTYTLFQELNDLRLCICEDIFTPLIGRKFTDTISSELSVAVKGVRVTNTVRYSLTSINDVHYLNSVQPLPLSTNALPPSRARVVDLLKTVSLASISTPTCSWDVYLSQPVDSLTIADFVVTSTGDIHDYTIESLQKVSEYKYLLHVNTGEGNGELTAFFQDRKTVKYKGTNTFISNYVGELNVEGETYIVNKSNPLPILTSGSNPYISNEFVVNLSFDSAISTLDETKIGLVNAQLIDVFQPDEDAHIYELTILPIAEGTVIVQCLEGTGITDIGLPSSKSAPLVRIYSESFPILQLPLDIANTSNDLSPSKLELTDVIANNTIFSSTVYPLGTNSSLEVNPVLEQSGLTYPNFNALGATGAITSEDWTIEFFLRINSTLTGTSKKAHILSVENPTTGFCLFADNGLLRLQRSVTSTSNLLGTFTWSEKDTTSYVDWTNNSFTSLQKYPHFAISKLGTTYRIYRNGIRIGILTSTTNIDITQGNLNVGYYLNRVDDVAYHLSNVRITLGKALYTAYQVNIPALPYNVLSNITDEAELLNFISIYSNSLTPNQAKTDDKIYLKFSSIITLTTNPVVYIAGQLANLTYEGLNIYKADITVVDTIPDGQVTFSIAITDEPGIPDKTFTNTTNNSKVFVDNTPLGASITSASINYEQYIVECTIAFTEPINSLTANMFTLVNCKLGNLRKVLNENKWTFTIIAINTGEMSVTLEANKVTDLVGNYNISSNIFTRNVVVPPYTPDIYFDNVLLLIQPEFTIADESNFNNPVTSTNIELVNTHSYSGVTKSIYFNGVDSSMQFVLNSTLDNNEPYTIEFFVYFASSVVFRLTKPGILPGSNITSNGFTANWSTVSEASSYKLDVSREAGFNTYITGYKDLNVGNVSNIPVNSLGLDYVPKLRPNTIKSCKGFLADWSYSSSDYIGFRYDVALDNNFTKPLYGYKDKLSLYNYSKIGDLTNASISPVPIPEVIDPEEDLAFNPMKGVLMTGLLSNANYPKLYYFLDENTLRFYDKSGYTLPAIAEDIDAGEWYHIALSNYDKHTNLYVNGELVDRVRSATFSNTFDVGYDIGKFYGYMTGMRITKGIARYKTNFDVPMLPYGRG